MEWLARRLLERHIVATPSVLDFGCGCGGSIPFLARLPGIEQLVGVDISPGSLERARSRHASRPATFLLTDALDHGREFDLVFCNGVFHHIERRDRLMIARRVAKMLRPGGVFAFLGEQPLESRDTLGNAPRSLRSRRATDLVVWRKSSIARGRLPSLECGLSVPIPSATGLVPASGATAVPDAFRSAVPASVPQGRRQLARKHPTGIVSGRAGNAGLPPQPTQFGQIGVGRRMLPQGGIL